MRIKNTFPGLWGDAADRAALGDLASFLQQVADSWAVFANE